MVIPTAGSSRLKLLKKLPILSRREARTRDQSRATTPEVPTATPLRATTIATPLVDLVEVRTFSLCYYIKRNRY